MKPLIFTCCVLFTLGLTSCYSIIGTTAGLHRKTVDVTELTVPNKQVAFVGMRHLGKKAYYADVKAVVERYQNLGYTPYLESIKRIGTNGEDMKVDTICLMKLRKITTMDLSRGYSKQQRTVFDKLVTTHNLIDQPKYTDLGVKKMLIMDIDYVTLIKYFELKYFEVTLDSCDLATPLGTRYKCSPFRPEWRRTFTDDVVLDIRNKYLTQQILTSSDDKILVIYGKGHLKGLKKELAFQTAMVAKK